MNQNQETKFIFCPRCGGLMEPPVCNICGFDMRPAPEETAIPNQAGDGSSPDMQGAQNAAQPRFVPNQNAQGQNPSAQGAIPPIKAAKKEDPKKKKKIWIPIAIAGTVILILAILCGPLVSTIGVIGRMINTKKTAQNTQVTSSSKPKTSQSESEDDSELPENTEYVMRHFGRFDHIGLDASFYENMADCTYNSSSGVFDPFLSQSDEVETWLDSSVFDSTHKNYTVDEIGPDYYEPFVDSIDEVSYSEQYQISRKYFFYDDLMGSYRIQASVAYPELSGNIPNLTVLNAQIYDRCTSDLLNYLNGSSPYSQYVFEKIVFIADSYITYNDGKKMSILLDCAVHTDDYWNCLDSYIYAINVDLEKGEIIENDEIINIDEAFAKQFRERCLVQNNSNSALDPLTDKEIASYLSSKENNIIFFTPIGLEVGMHYLGKDDILARGWMTITLKYGEFDKMLKDPGLLSTGNPTRIRTDQRYANLIGGWTNVDEALGEKEEKEVRTAYPNYDWNELTLDEVIEEHEKEVEEAEKNNGTTTPDPDQPDWYDDYEDLEKYFNNQDLYNFYIEADDYFKLHKGEKQKEEEISSEEEDSEEDTSEADSEEDEEDSEEEENSEEDEEDSEKESESESSSDKKNGRKGGFIQ
ncbi:MAG: hypothetical protein IKO32_08070 [Lachnospiraceae bacterium]|nr:hypothetical protein [Lachnospiraceae bacterium]